MSRARMTARLIVFMVVTTPILADSTQAASAGRLWLESSFCSTLHRASRHRPRPQGGYRAMTS